MVNFVKFAKKKERKLSLYTDRNFMAQELQLLTSSVAFT